MRADADDDQPFRLAGTRCRRRSADRAGRRVDRVFGRLDLLGRAVVDEDRLAAPRDGQALADLRPARSTSVVDSASVSRAGFRLSMNGQIARRPRRRRRPSRRCRKSRRSRRHGSVAVRRYRPSLVILCASPCPQPSHRASDGRTGAARYSRVHEADRRCDKPTQAHDRSRRARGNAALPRADA